MRRDKFIWCQTLDSWWVMEMDVDLFWVVLLHCRAFQKQLSSSGSYKRPGREARDPGPVWALPSVTPACAEYKEPCPFPLTEPLSRNWFPLDKWVSTLQIWEAYLKTSQFHKNLQVSRYLINTQRLIAFLCLGHTHQKMESRIPTNRSDRESTSFHELQKIHVKKNRPYLLHWNTRQCNFSVSPFKITSE